MARNPYNKQIGNRNFLSATSFKFNLAKCPKVDFFSNSCNIPGLSLPVAVQPTYLNDIPRPGDRLDFEDFTLRFLIDENLENLMEIQKWMRGLGYPESVAEALKLTSGAMKFEDQETDNPDYNTSDGTLSILNSSQNAKFMVKFSDLFPVAMTGMDFDATEDDTAYFTAQATFKFTLYEIVDVYGQPLYES